MASLIRHKNGVYYVVVSLNGKRIWRSLHTRIKRDAYALYLDQYPARSAGSESSNLAHAQEEYLAYVKTNFSQATVDVYRNVFHNFNRFLNGKPAGAVTPRDLEAYKSYRLPKVSVATVNQEIRSLKAFFNKLKVWGMLNESPCDGVKEIRVAETEKLYLSKADLIKLLGATKGTQLHDIVLFAVMTGLRRGEILNLTWEDIDLNRSVLTVRSSVNYSVKGRKIRTVPINSTVMELLMRQPTRSGVLFPGERSSKNNGNFVSKQFKKAVMQCGLDKSLHFHSLRHTFASLLVKQGVSLYHVQRLLGHSSPRVTQMYAHLSGSELAGVVESLVV